MWRAPFGAPVVPELKNTHRCSPGRGSTASLGGRTAGSASGSARSHTTKAGGASATWVSASRPHIPRKSKPRHSLGVTTTEGRTCAIATASSRSREMGSRGTCTAPRRDSATIVTSDSIQVGSCQHTGTPGPTPR